jgi:hypothetical protein
MEPEWNHEYSARETYNDPEHPLTPEEPLSPVFWHRAVERMKQDRVLFEKYLKFESKISADAKPCEKGSVCEMEALCQMEASTVIQNQACTAEAMAARGGNVALKKPNKKEPYGVTRAGKVIRVEDYDEQRGFRADEGMVRRDLWAPGKRRLVTRKV